MNPRLIVIALLAAAGPASLLAAADLGSYRNFRLGMSVAEVAKQAGIAASDAKLISSRPQRIDELDWRVGWTPASAAQSEPYRELLFRFYNGGLYDIALTYDHDRTAGLTDGDMVDAISGMYGSATRPTGAEMIFHAGSSQYVGVIARWQDPHYLLSLVHLPYGAGYGLVISASAEQASADKAMLESDRLDRVEAPQRESALRARQLAETAAADEKARELNKAGFRP